MTMLLMRAFHPELDHLLTLLKMGCFYRDPTPGRGAVTGLEHALQVATRAEAAGEPASVVVMALLHDAARPLCDANHGAVIAEILAGRLRDDELQALRHHGEFQAEPLSSLGRYQQESWYGLALRLAVWDAVSFDPDYRAQPLEHFLPLLEALYE